MFEKSKLEKLNADSDVAIVVANRFDFSTSIFIDFHFKYMKHCPKPI